MSNNIALPATLTARLAKELKQLTLTPPYNFTVQQSTDNILHYTAQIIGPVDTPYANGIYTIDIIVPLRYPFVPPQCQFVTSVYHPNIDDTGRICCSILSLPPTGTWKPIHNIAAVCTSLYSLLQSPNCDDPLMHNIAQQLTNNYNEYYTTAKEWNDKYAVQTQSDDTQQTNAESINTTQTADHATLDNAQAVDISDLSVKPTTDSTEEKTNDTHESNDTQPIAVSDSTRPIKRRKC